ncbi:MAG: hypothetical protein H6719_06800 [Sandaracinaceae bacterium]|nr:hypothetical protein [Sandaracinaceae bacterium]
MILVAVGFVAQLLVSLGFLAATAAASRALGVPVHRLQLGLGPRVFERSVGSVTLALGAVPLASYAQFTPDPDEAAGDPDAPPPSAYDQAPRLTRVAITAAGLTGMALLPLIGLGPVEGALAITHGVPQLLLGAVSPLGTGRHLVEAAAALPPLTLGPTLGAKMLAYNLLPLPGTTLGFMLGSVLGIPATSRARLLALVPLAIAIAWLVALGAWAFS